MPNKICLAGNPNCGKTSLFNLLTGKNERVGNRAGVSVESKVGRYKKDKTVTLIDLPGTYSLKSVSSDERVVTDFFTDYSGVIVSVLDGMNLERGLRLTSELTRLQIPMVIAINFCDEMKKRGIKIDLSAMERAFGVPIVLISARKNIGIDRLMTAVNSAKVPINILPEKQDDIISKIVKTALKDNSVVKDTFTDKADRVLLNKYLGIPFFALIMVAVYYFTAVVGGFFGDGILGAISALSVSVKNALKLQGANEWFIGLICGAVIGGVGEVLSFLPQILVLFFLLAVMEETGYLSRAAFLFDGLMEKVGLGGKSLIALGVSCGCSVSGIMSTRTIENERTKRLTVMLSPFMPCGAKTAVFAWFSGLIFGGNPFITASLYFLSVFSVAFFGAVLKRFNRFKGGGGLIMEIPVLRLPSVRGVFGALKEKTADFILKAGSVIFVVSVCVWFLQSFGIHGYAYDITDSFLFFIGDKIKFIFIPLGFGTWQCSVAVISSAFAKEAVIQTLSMIAENPAALFLSGYSAYAFMAFILLMPPCAAALTTAKRELNNRKDFYFMLFFQFSAAYLVAFIINITGVLLENYGYLFIPLTCTVFGFIISVLVIKKTRRNGCRDCRLCGGEKCRKKKVNTTT